MSRTFQALVVRESDDKIFTRANEERSIDDLPQGDVLIRVHFWNVRSKGKTVSHMLQKKELPRLPLRKRAIALSAGWRKFICYIKFSCSGGFLTSHKNLLT